MAVVKFEKNGQGFYDFDALLNATSEEFVQTIKEHLELTILDRYKDKYTVKVQLDNRITNVYIFCKVGTPSVEIFQYYHSTGHINRAFLIVDELKMLAGELNE